MRALLVFLFALVVLASAFHTEEQYQKLFKHFIKQHNKHYHVDEFHVRYQTFKMNLDIIADHNKKSKSTFKLGVNSFADQTNEEFKSKFLGYKMIDRSLLRSRNQVGAVNTTGLPSSVDFRLKNAVTPVKNQGQCGACWAFSTTGATEGAHALATGKLVSLSEQQLVDCSSAQGNAGCNGGLMDQGFQYIITNQGICTEDAYPYSAADGTCASSSCQTAATISSFVDVTPNSETSLLAAAAGRPISIAIEADQNAFQFYTSGVLNDASCGTSLDHGVLIVGYNIAASPAYWIVKNSWGNTWGEQGYIRIAYGVASANQCGLTSDPSYPIV